jgi:hypothetical protein
VCECWPEIITTALVSLVAAVCHWLWHSDITYWMGYLDGKADGKQEQQEQDREAAQSQQRRL